MAAFKAPSPGPWRTGCLIAAAVALASTAQWVLLRPDACSGLHFTLIVLGALVLVAGPLGMALWAGRRQRRTLVAEVERGEVARRLLRQSLARQRAVFEGSEMVAMILAEGTGPRPRIAEFNPGAEKMFGVAREQMLGRPLDELFAGDGRQTLARILDAGRDAGAWPRNTRWPAGRRGVSGAGRAVRVHGQGGMEGLLLTAVDIAKRKHSEAVTYLLYRISDAVSATRDLIISTKAITASSWKFCGRAISSSPVDEKNDRWCSISATRWTARSLKSVTSQPGHQADLEVIRTDAR
jgi:PAS domain S-box-containing protein